MVINCLFPGFFQCYTANRLKGKSKPLRKWVHHYLKSSEHVFMDKPKQGRPHHILRTQALSTRVAQTNPSAITEQWAICRFWLFTATFSKFMGSRYPCHASSDCSNSVIANIKWWWRPCSIPAPSNTQEKSSSSKTKRWFRLVLG